MSLARFARARGVRGFAMIGLSLDHGKKYKVSSAVSVDSKERRRLGVRSKEGGKSSGATDEDGSRTGIIKTGFGETPKPASLLVAGDRFELPTFGL